MKKKRLHIILATVLFAILLWISVNLGHQYQVSITSPLTVANIPAERAISTPVPRSLQLRFRGDGWRLAALMLGGDLNYVLDVRALPAHQRVLTLNDVAEQLNIPVGVQVIDMKPESLFVSLETYVQRGVPVILHKTFSFREGYGMVGAPLVTPESVVVGGALSVVESIRGWRTAGGVVENLKGPLDVEVPLADASTYLITVSPRSVRVRVNVQPVAEKVLPGIAVEALSIPPYREVIFIPPKIEVVVRGGIEQLSGLAAQDIRASVEYDTLLADTTGFVQPVVIPPDGLQLVSRRPERLQYVIRKSL